MIRLNWLKNTRESSSDRDSPFLAPSMISLPKSCNIAAKHSSGTSKQLSPQPFLHFVYQEDRRSTLAAHVALGCRGVGCCGFPLSATASREQVVSSALRPASSPASPRRHACRN